VFNEYIYRHLHVSVALLAAEDFNLNKKMLIKLQFDKDQTVHSIIT